MNVVIGFPLILIGAIIACSRLPNGLIRSIPFSFLGGFLMFHKPGELFFPDWFYNGMIFGFASVFFCCVAGFFARIGRGHY